MNVEGFGQWWVGRWLVGSWENRDAYYGRTGSCYCEEGGGVSCNLQLYGNFSTSIQTIRVMGLFTWSNTDALYLWSSNYLCNKLLFHKYQFIFSGFPFLMFIKSGWVVYHNFIFDWVLCLQALYLWLLTHAFL